MKKLIFLKLALVAGFMAMSFVMPDNAAAFGNWWDWDWDWNPTPRDAPEIDPNTISSAIAIAAGGWAILGDKLRRR